MHSSKSKKTLDPVEVAVTRDPKTGAIVSIDTPEDNKNPLNDPLADVLDSEDDEDAAGEWGSHEMSHVPKTGGEGSAVVRQLEELARGGARKAPRKQSEREQEWVERLVRKYGEDYGKMARDMKLNPMQQTSADIRKRVEKWKETQG